MKFESKANKSMALIAIMAVAVMSLTILACVPADGDGEITYTATTGTSINASTPACNYGLYATPGAPGTITISGDAAFTSKMACGTYLDTVFTPLIVIDLTGVNNLKFIYEFGDDFVTVTKFTTDLSFSGAVKVEKGTAMFENLTGTIKGLNSTYTAVNITGLTLTASNATDTFYGTIAKGSGTANASLKVGGTAKLGPDTIIGTAGNSITVTIDEGANITGDLASMMPYKIESGKTFGLRVGKTAAADSAKTRAYGCIMDSSDVIVAQVVDSAVPTDGIIKFTTNTVLSPLMSYKMFLALGEDIGGTATYGMYFGNVTFTQTATSAGVLTVGLNLDAELPMTKVNASSALATYSDACAANTLVTKNGYTPVYGACSVTDGSGVKNTATVAANTITLSADKIAADIAVLLCKNNAGKYFAIYGACSGVATAIDSTITTSFTTLTVNTTAGKNNIEPKTFSAYAERTAFTIASDASLDVKGKLDFKYLYGDNAVGITHAGGVITVSGSIAYASNSNVVPFTYTSATKGITSPCAIKTSTTAPKFECFYAPIDVAVTKGPDVDFYGPVVITCSVILKGTPEGTTVLPNKFVIAANSSVTLGRTSADPAVPSVSADVTLPVTSSLTVSAQDKFIVANGKFSVIAGAVIDNAAFIKSDVENVATGATTYTDLSTALTLAVSGDTLKLRKTGISLARDSEIKTGVVLDTNGVANFEIAKNAKLTIVGELKADPTTNITVVADATTPGVLSLASTKVKISTLTLNGVLEYAAAFDNTETAAGVYKITTLTAGAGSMIKVAGKMTFKDAIASKTAFDVTGIAVFDCAIGADSDMTIKSNGKVVKKDVTSIALGKLMMADGAELALDSASVNPYKWGSAVISAATGVNNVKATVVLNDDAKTTRSAIVMGVAANVVVKYADSTAVVSTAQYKKSDLLNTQYSCAGSTVNNVMAAEALVGHTFDGWYANTAFTGTKVTSAKVGEYPALHAKYDPIKFTVTFGYATGVKWLLDTVEVSGNVDVAYGTHKVTIVAEPGYDVGKVTLKMGDAAYTKNTDFNVDGALSFTATDASQIDNTMLYIIIAVIVIVGVVVAVVLLKKKGVF